MLFLQKWFNVLFLSLGLLVCYSNQVQIQQINLKFNRLNRITNVLQKDVEDIWTVLSNIATVKVNQSSTTETDQGYSNTEKALNLVNETISDVEKLKTEVKELVVYAQHGFKNEKAFCRESIQELQKRQAFSHEAMQELQKRQSDFETNLTNSTVEMKILLQKYKQIQEQSLENRLEDFRSKTATYETETAKNKLDIKECLDKMETVEEKITSIEKYLFDKIACDDGWESFGTSCYYYSLMQMSWDDAWESCKANQSYLVEVKEKTETDFLVEIIGNPPYETNSIWVGGNDRETEGTFIWQTSRESISLDYYAPGEPSNLSGEEHCVEMYGLGSLKGQFNNRRCYRAVRFVCEKSI